MFHFLRIPAIAVLVLTTFLSSASLGEEGTTPPDVQFSATTKRISETEFLLTVTGEIRDGLHIYAQTQPKPFLATKFTLAPHPAIRSVGDFTPSRPPTKHTHPQLNVELHEHFGTLSWEAVIRIDPDIAPPATWTGEAFAQACEETRCHAPHTYPLIIPVPVSPVDSMTIPTEQETRSASTFELDAVQREADPETQSIAIVLPLAFLAGLLLNFMPCVLPVVGLKLLSFVQQAQSNRRRVLLMNLAYTAGLLSVMLTLATLATFAGLGWGEQFSSAGFTITLAAIVFAFALSFLGVWELSLPGFVGAAGSGTPQEGYTGAFSKGVLSTVLATPCSGPFLGAALAWAIVQPVIITYITFLTVGLGMASPYLLVGLFPKLVRFLPQPGNWMITFKHVMGFVMLATVVYLMSFIAFAALVPTVLLLLGIGVGLWLIGRIPFAASNRRRLVGWGFGGTIVLTTAVLAFAWLEPLMASRFERAAQQLTLQTGSDAELVRLSKTTPNEPLFATYSKDRLETAIRNGRSVFVDFTADWCLTCQANEATAIDSAAFRDAVADRNVLVLKADKTRSNPAADRLLRQLGNASASIPFYAYFSAERPHEPVTIDGVFTSPQPLVDLLETDSDTPPVPSGSLTASR